MFDGDDQLGVPVGSYFVNTFLDYDRNRVYESPWPDDEVSWIYGEPNYTVTETRAAPDPAA